MAICQVVKIWVKSDLRVNNFGFCMDLERKSSRIVNARFRENDEFEHLAIVQQ